MILSICLHIAFLQKRIAGCFSLERSSCFCMLQRRSTITSLLETTLFETCCPKSGKVSLTMPWVYPYSAQSGSGSSFTIGGGILRISFARSCACLRTRWVWNATQLRFSRCASSHACMHRLDTQYSSLANILPQMVVALLSIQRIFKQDRNRGIKV